MLRHRSITVVSVIVLLSLSPVACGDDDTGDTPPADTGPRADTALPDGARPDAGPILDAGDAGSPDAGDTGASEDAGPTPGALDPALVLRAGALWGSCIPDDGVNRFLQQTYGNRSPDERIQSREVIECLAAATDGCAATERCLGVTFELGSPDGCEPTCDGDRLSVCDDSWHFGIDCSRVGLTCDAAARECIPRAPEACDPDTAGPAMCGSDGRTVLCDADGYTVHGPVCQTYGLECRTVAEIGEDACVGRDGPCEATSWSPIDIELQGVACADAENLDACVNGGLHRVACADVATGFGCQSAGAEVFCGLGSECAPGMEDESCDGDTLVVCHAGRVERVDCLSLGFIGCAPGPTLGITAGCV